MEVAGKLDLEIDVEINFLRDGNKGDRPAWQQKLWVSCLLSTALVYIHLENDDEMLIFAQSNDGNLLNLCFPMNIPSLLPSKHASDDSSDSSSEQASNPGSDMDFWWPKDSDQTANQPDSGTNFFTDNTNTNLASSETNSGDNLYLTEPNSMAPGNEVATTATGDASSTDSNSGPASDSQTLLGSSLDSILSADSSGLFDESPTASGGSAFSIPDIGLAIDSAFSPASSDTLPGATLTGSTLPGSSPSDSTSPYANLLSLDPDQEGTGSGYDLSLPTRNPKPEGTTPDLTPSESPVPELGEGSHFVSAINSGTPSLLPTDLSLFASNSPQIPTSPVADEQSSLFASNDVTGAGYNDNYPPLGGDQTVQTANLPEGGGEQTRSQKSTDLPEIGEGSHFENDPAPASASAPRSGNEYAVSDLGGLGDLGDLGDLGVLGDLGDLGTAGGDQGNGGPGGLPDYSLFGDLFVKRV